MTEVAVYESQSPALPERTGVPGTQDFDSWVAVASDVIKLAAHIADTVFVPEGLRGSAPAVAAAILAGREMGLGPMTSLANIDVIKGRPAPKAVLMRALVQSRGHHWLDVDVSDVRAVVKGRRKGEAEWTEVTFTAAQAKVAGIDLGRYPADKLYARASSRLARRRFADCVMGMPYSEDEAEDQAFPDAADELPSAEAKAIEPARPRTAQRRTKPADTPTGAPSASGKEEVASPPRPAPATTAPSDQPSTPTGQPPLPGEDDEPDPTPPPEPATASPPPGSATGNGDRHRKLVGTVHQHFTRLGFADDERDARLAACEAITGAKRLTSSNDLGVEQLSAVADTLARCKDRGMLIALLAETERTAQEAAERAFQAGDTNE